MNQTIIGRQPLSASSNHQATLRQIEKRSHFRNTVSIQVETVALETGTTAVGTVSDLGFGGCFVETKRPFHAGMRVGVRFSSEGRSFRCRALITHAEDGLGMGLVFTEADPTETASVLEWVASVGQEKAHSVIDA